MDAVLLLDGNAVLLHKYMTVAIEQMIRSTSGVWSEVAVGSHEWMRSVGEWMEQQASAARDWGR